MTDLDQTPGARGLAQDVAVYYNTLLGNGVSEEAALDLTHGYLDFLVGIAVGPAPSLSSLVVHVDHATDDADLAARIAEHIGPVLTQTARTIRAHHRLVAGPGPSFTVTQHPGRARPR